LDDWQVVKSAAVAVIGIDAVVVMRHLAGRWTDLEWVVGDVLERARRVELSAKQHPERRKEMASIPWGEGIEAIVFTR
jgi:hypothetical protein